MAPSKTTIPQPQYASRAAHIRALMAAGMTERAARIAELKAFMALAQARRKAAQERTGQA